jgi:hypothetical protein
VVVREKEPDCNATKGRAEGETWEKRDRTRGTHPQETAEEGTCHEVERMHPAQVLMRQGDRIHTVDGMTSQDMEGKVWSKGYSPTGDGRGRNTSDHETKTSERQALTSGDGQWEGRVETRKGSGRGRGTHPLERVKVVTAQEVERKQARGAHLLKQA